MIEGDLIAGELDIPIEWLEMLAQEERVRYIEPGLWIAAEHADKYAAALVSLVTFKTFLPRIAESIVVIS